MVKTIYKTLFEVKLLHEYYLTNNEGDTVFDLTNQTARMNFLLDRFEKSLASINDVLEYRIPVFLSSTFKDYHLHLLTTFSGFEIAAEVKEKALPDGTLLYSTAATLPDDLDLYILLCKKNITIDVVTNNRIKAAIPYVYFFSNENVITPKVFPSLSGSIPPFDAATIYEQGELASFGTNDIRQFYVDNNSDQWNAVAGNGYANTQDQLIVPWQFAYRFNAADNVTNARFELLNKDGNLTRTYNFSSDTPLQKVILNFSNNKTQLPPLTAIIAGEIYTLNVIVNSNITVVHKVMFFKENDLSNDYWAVIHIKPKVTNPDFNIYAPDGFIKLRKTAGGNTIPAPVFEIRVKSRFTFWRYIQDEQQQLNTSADTVDFLVSSGNNLISKMPRASTYLPTLFKKTADNTFHYLPNPASYKVMSSEDRQLYTDITVPKSTMFPTQ